MRLLYLAWLLGACGENPAIDRARATCADPERGPEVNWFAEADANVASFAYASPDYRGGGLAVADLDGDGLPELVAGSRAGGLAVFHNLGKLKFAPMTSTGLDPTLAVDALAAVDLDNDGDVDLVIASRDVTYVMENLGDGTFRQAAELVGTGATEHVLATDLDGDGLLDLYLSNRDLEDPVATQNRLYMNRGQLDFVATPPIGAGLSWTTTAFDFDGDGDQDLYVANDTLLADYGWPEPVNTLPTDLLLRNDGLDASGIPQFTDVAGAMGLDQPHSSMAGVVGDYNDDGQLDLFVSNLGAKKLYLRTETGFEESAEAMGVQAISRINTDCVAGTTHEDCLFLSWAGVLADFDLDGHEELLVANGESVGALPPILMFTRGTDPTFHEVAPDIACLDAQALIATDLDGDGDQDLVISQTNGPMLVYENLGTPKAWMRVELHGVTSNRQGIGSTVTLHMTSGRTQIRVVGSGGVVHSSTPAEAVFGLGSDTVERLDVTWPSGRTTTVDHPPRGQLLVTESS